MGPTSADLIRHAKKSGDKLSTRQLERWRNARLLPASRRHGQGRGRGSVWNYEPNAIERLDVIPRFERTGFHSPRSRRASG